MSGYIDADEAMMAIAECFLDMNDSFVESATECNAMIDLAIDKIKELPTADVQPVKRGEWKSSRPDAPMFGFYYCSLCGRKRTSPQDKYCPNCGADMRGGRNEQIR